MYRVVNGVKGSSVFNKVGISSSTINWDRALVTIDGSGLAETDMVEVCVKCLSCSCLTAFNYLNLQQYLNTLKHCFTFTELREIKLKFSETLTEFVIFRYCSRQPPRHPLLLEILELMI